MTKIVWDGTGERLYETGVDHGVLYTPDPSGNYATGVAWNGLTTVTEAPSGAESSPQYADNIKYVELTGPEEYGGTIEAFTYPDEFGQHDGTASPAEGVYFGQQGRKPFGLCYRTLIGNDTEGQDHGYKLHLIYGAKASPSEKSYATVNDSPEAMTLSWEFTTTGAPATGYKPVSSITVDSTKVSPTGLAALEAALYGDETLEARLPLPDEVASLLATT